MKSKKDLTAPCGLDCFNCELFEDNLTEALAEVIHRKFGVSKEKSPARVAASKTESTFIYRQMDVQLWTA